MLTPPPILPFQRLRIYDGLSIDADRWQSTHRYHRLRQNFHYQSLNQGGIICGLGVYPISDPTQVSNRSSAESAPPLDQSSRWVKIQPGIAIDGAGNPIIVPEPITFQFQSELRQGETQTIYLVANYRDPDDLRHTLEQDYVQELFRIQERTLLDPLLDIELCRIELTSGNITISLPQDLMTPKPGFNCLNLNHRAIAQTKPQSLIQIGLLHDDSHNNDSHNNDSHNSDRTSRWLQFLQALPQLHKHLESTAEIADIPLLGISQNPHLNHQHLLHIDQVTLLKQINATDSITALRSHLQSGGTLLIQVDPLSLNITELSTIAQELHHAIADASTTNSADPTQRQDLQNELLAIKTEIATALEQIPNQLSAIASKLGNPLQGNGQCLPTHSLKTTPFIFGQLPIIDHQPLYLLNWDGIIVMVGDLSQHWIGSEQLSRDTIRTAQELGTNLLHYAWQRHQKTTLTKP